jgi:hypothetical protein
MIVPLPTYFTPVVASVTNYSGRMLEKFSKRNRWLKSTCKSTQKQIVKKKTNDLKNLKRQCRQEANTSKAQGKVAIFDSNDIINDSVTKNLYGKKTITNETVITINDKIINDKSEGVYYNKKLFEEWSNSVKKKKSNKVNTKQKVICNNYYQTLAELKYTEEQDNMPELLPDWFQAPTFSMTNSVQPNIRNNKEEEKTWNTIVSKEKKREFHATHDLISQKYLPRNIIQLTEPILTNDDMKTKYVIPLSIRMKTKKNSRATIRPSRVVVAILNSMKKVFPETNIGPLIDNQNLPNINNATEVPTSDNKLKHYLATPINGTNNMFFGKIHIHSNHTIKEYKQNNEFTQYLKNEGIIVDINDLDDINPTQLGLYENIDIVHQRIKKMMPENTPKFQLTIQTLFANSVNTKIVMIKCDERNKDELKTLFEELHNKNKLNFFHWERFINLEPGQKLTIVNRNKEWRLKFRTYLIKGFIDNGNNIPMIYKEDMANEDDPLLKTTVTKYLQNHIKDLKGNNLFEFVYPPINGVREVLVRAYNATLALEFINICHSELARNMDDESIHKVFENPITVLTSISATVWTPTEKLDTVPITELISETPNNNTKRQKPTPPEEFTVITNNNNHSISNLTSVTANNTSMPSTNWQEELENLKNSLTTSIINTIESKMDEKIENKISGLREEVVTNSNSNKELTESVKAIKEDLLVTRDNMKEDMISTRTSIGLEMDSIREEIKTSETKTTTKLDDNSTKLDSNNSKLDEILKMFAMMNKPKENTPNCAEKQQISGKKRELQNKSIDDSLISGRKDVSFIFNPDNNPFSNIPFLHNLGWRSNRQDMSGILDMEIHDSQYVADSSFENCDNLEYQDKKETKVNKVNKYKSN